MRRMLLVAALLCGCREKAGPPPAAEPQAPVAPQHVQEQEPNDFQRAQQIPARAIVAGTLQAPRDDDWNRVGPGAGKILALRIELQPGKPVRGTYLTAEDEDWFRLVVPPGSLDVLRIEVTPVAGVRLELEVRALADAALLASFRGTDGLFVRDLSLRLGERADAGVADGGVTEDAGVADGGAQAAEMDAGAAVSPGAGYYLV